MLEKILEKYRAAISYSRDLEPSPPVLADELYHCTIWEAYTHTHTHTHYPWKDIQEIANSSCWEQGLGVSGCKIEVRKHFPCLILPI